MNIGVFLNYDSDEKIGGGNSYFYTVISAIDSYQFSPDVHVFFVCEKEQLHFKQKKCITIGNKIPFSVKAILLILKYLNYFFKGFLFFRNRSEVIKNKFFENDLKQAEIDILYFPTPSLCSINIPYIATCWDLGHKSTFSFPELTMNGSYDARVEYFSKILSKAFAVIAESNSGKSEIVKFQQINPERIFVVPMIPGNVIDLNVSNEDQELILNQSNLTNNGYFYYPAQFWSHKNHYTLICAFKEYKIKNPTIKLVFTGSDKGNLTYINSYIQELGLEDSIINLGFVSQDVVFTLYKNTISLIYTSLLGPTNMPLLEAHYLGVKIICSDLPGHREQLGGNAQYVDPLNPFDICQKMDLAKNSSSKILAPLPNYSDLFCSQLNTCFSQISASRRLFGRNYNQY
jgi:glycosyltransferase involved in cell wall biosynthesis